MLPFDCVPHAEAKQWPGASSLLCHHHHVEALAANGEHHRLHIEALQACCCPCQKKGLGGSNFDVYQFNDLTNTATTTTTTTSTDDGAVNMDIIKEFDRDYMKLRGRLIDLIEKQSHGKTSNVNNIQKSSSVELLDSNDHE